MAMITLLLLSCEESEPVKQNHSPNIQSFGVIDGGVEGGTFAILYCSVQDADNDSLEYIWTAPEGTIYGSGDTVSWKAPIEVSQYPIYCRVEDGRGGYAEINFDVQVYPNILFSESAWTFYNESNQGLPNYTIDDVWSIALDELNRVWVGLDVGYFYMFDGTDWHGWKPYNDAAEIFSVDIDSENNAWITGGTLAKWDGGGVKEYYRRCPPGQRCLYPSGITIDEYDNVWVGFYNHSGPSKFDGVQWTDFDSLGLPPADDIAIDKYGDIWYTADSSLVHYDHNSWTVYDGPNPSWLNSIVIDHDNHIWVITESWDLALYDGSSWTYFPVPFTVKYPMINDIVIDNNNNLWCALDEGLAILDGTLSKNRGIGMWQTFLTDENSPLPDGWVSSLTFDSEGNLWGGTHSYGASGPGGGGLFKIDLAND